MNISTSEYVVALNLFSLGNKEVDCGMRARFPKEATFIVTGAPVWVTRPWMRLSARVHFSKVDYWLTGQKSQLCCGISSLMDKIWLIFKYSKEMVVFHEKLE